MASPQAPIPQGNASLERHGIRGFQKGKDPVTQIGFLRNRCITLSTRLVKERLTLTKAEELDIKLQLFILQDLLGYKREDIKTGVVNAYQRTFSEWYGFAVGKYPEVSDVLVLQQHLANAWREVNKLFDKNPR